MVKLALLTLSLAACGIPTPEGVPLANHMPASAFVLERYGSVLPVPLVWGVAAECASAEGWPGFSNPDTGACVGGMRLGSEIWLVVAPGQRYSSRLCHEIAHYVHGDSDHARPDVWARPDGAEWTCAAALEARPDLDIMILR